MRKILYFLAAGVITGGFITSCDNEPKNPGDFTVKAELSIGQMVSQVTGEAYTFHIARTIDSIYKTPVQVWDTVWNAAGEFESRTADTIWYPAKFTTKFIEIDPVILDSQADTFNITLQTNAKWLSPTPEYTGVQWLYNESTTSGGGDGFLTLRSARNRNYSRTTYNTVYIFTSDSTVMYKIPFGQKGEKDEE